MIRNKCERASLARARMLNACAKQKFHVSSESELLPQERRTLGGPRNLHCSDALSQ